MNIDTSTATQYTKAMSNTGTIHLAAVGSAEAMCASGKARPLVTPLTADEQTRPITCKRCEKAAAKIDAERIAAAANTADIDAVLAEMADTNALGAELVAAITEASASDTEAAEEAAERDAAEAAPAAAEIAPAAPAGTAAPRLDQPAMILAYLEANKGLEFTPHEISKAITPEGRKALGLRDACARMARDGKITAIDGKPIKYTLPAAPRPKRATPKGKAADRELVNA